MCRGQIALKQCVGEACVEVLAMPTAAGSAKAARTGHLLNKPWSYHTGTCTTEKKDGDFLFTGRHREQTGGNRYKLHEERFHLDFDSLKEKNKFTGRTITQKKIIPRYGVKCPLEAFKMRLDRVTISSLSHKKLDQVIFGIPLPSGLDLHVQKVSHISI